MGASDKGQTDVSEATIARHLRAILGNGACLTDAFDAWDGDAKAVATHLADWLAQELTARLVCAECGSTKGVKDYNALSYIAVEPEFLCADCSDSRAEGAFERSLEDFYGGSTPQTDLERLEQARKLK